MNKKNKIMILFLLLLVLFGINLIIDKTYSYQSLYDAIPENSIIIGEEVYTGFVNPNIIANSAIKTYKNTKDKNIKIYKYSGLDENGIPIWGTYSDEANGYIEVSNEEIKKLEEILSKKYNVNNTY